MEGNAMMRKDMMRKEAVRRPDELNLVSSPTRSRCHCDHTKQITCWSWTKSIRKRTVSLFYSKAFFPTSRLLLFALRALLSVSRIGIAILRWCQDSPSRSFLKTRSTESDDASLLSSITMGMRKEPWCPILLLLQLGLSR